MRLSATYNSLCDAFQPLSPINSGHKSEAVANRLNMRPGVIIHKQLTKQTSVVKYILT